MHFDILGLMQNEMVKKALAEAKASSMETTFADIVVGKVNSNIDLCALERASTALGASVFALSPNNPFELTDLQRVSAENALKASAFRVHELLKDTFKHDRAIEKKFKEGGDMEGITDPALIMQSIVAHYAEKAAQSSVFGRSNRSWGNDDEFYNTQSGGEGVAMVINLTDKTVAPVPGMQQAKVNDLTINVDATRDRVIITGVNGLPENEVTVISNDVRNGQVDTVTAASGKALLCVRWPNSRYGEIVKGQVRPQEVLCKDTTLDEAAIINWDLQNRTTDDALGLYVGVQYGYEVGTVKEPLQITRRMIHERITTMMNDPKCVHTYVPPHLMQDMIYKDVQNADGTITRIPCISIPVVKSIFDPAVNTYVLEGSDIIQKSWERTVEVYNEQHGGEGVSKVIDISATNENNGGEKLPITREMCGNGNKYSCLVCGKTGLKKNGLSQLKPPKLPEGMANDYPGVADSVKYENSWMCGTCADALRKQREAAVKAFNTAKQEAAKATAEEEAVLREVLDAEQQVTSAKDLVDKTTLDNEKIKDALGELPPYAAAALEDAKFNLQQAETNYATISLKLNAFDRKATAISNGTAIPIGPAPKPAASGNSLGEAISKATANKAVVLSKPNGKNKNKGKNRHERRVEAAKARV